jgi:7-carboxy-7-deazaguanine synthase
VSAPAAVRVAERFISIQGESTFAGLPCFFIRLAGCNLACAWCDTPSARDPGAGADVAVAELVAEAAAARAAIVEITGGEPLLQPGFPALAAALRDGCGKPVLVETNGSRDLSLVPAGVIAIVDVKPPGSGESARNDAANIARLRPADEVKFVLADRADYEWALAFVLRHGLAARCRAVHFSPAAGRLEAAELARWLLADSAPARLHIQLHKAIGLR